MSRRTRNDLRSMGVRLPYAGACGKGTTRLDSSDSSGFRMLRPMERAADDHVAAKLKVLIRHLVANFPQTSILFREIGGRYYLFVIVPYSGRPEKVIQVDQAVLREHEVTEDEFAWRVNRLHLPTILQGCARYDFGPHS